MKLLIAIEQHFIHGPEGHVWVRGPANYSLWSRYLEEFDELVVLARVAPKVGSDDETARADGPGVSFWALPDYHGPWQYLRDLRRLKAAVRRAVGECDAYILRLPGLLGRLALQEINGLGRPYALEVVGDPWDALGPGTWPSILRPFLRRAAVRQLRAACGSAMAVHYVTQHALQRRYPPGDNAYAVGFSDALMDSAFASPQILQQRNRRIDEMTQAGGNRRNRFRIGFIGSLARMYKGPDVLLRAAAECCSRGQDYDFVIVGDGRHAGAMKALAKRVGIGDRTRFVGQLPYGQAVFDFLDSVDLFVMPSRAEGLPRALLEAMARGCPCIGSEVGGIPELLDSVDMVPPGDSSALADRIICGAGDTQRLKEMSERNLEKARQYRPQVLEESRRVFYRKVRERSVRL